MVVLDSNLVTVALPSIRADLRFSRPGLQWVIGAYSLGFGGSLLVLGRAGDLYGRRRLFTDGLVTFSLASVAVALAPTRPALLGARAVEGLAAAMAVPASLALMANLFDEGESRNRALGVYGMAVSAAFVSGVSLGGVLTALAGWRSVFVLNPLLGIAAALTARSLLADDKARGRPGDLDLPGAVAAVGAMGTLLYGLGLAGRTGRLSPSSCVLFELSVLLAGLAWVLERRSRVPLVPAVLLRTRTVASACTAALLTVGTGVGVMFVLTLYLQEVLGYGPISSGFALTLLGVAGVAAGWVAPRVAGHLGLPRALAVALVIQAAGVALLVPIGADGGLPFVLAGSAVIGMGHFAATVIFTALATSRVCERHQGVTMGLVSSAQQIGGALGLALLVAVASARTNATAEDGVTTGVAVVDGFRFALGVGVGLSLLAAVLVLALSRSKRR
jgi:MFS family permease